MSSYSTCYNDWNSGEIIETGEFLASIENNGTNPPMHNFRGKGGGLNIDWIKQITLRINKT